MERYHYHCHNILIFCFRVLYTITYPFRNYVPNPYLIYTAIFIGVFAVQIYVIINWGKISDVLELGDKYRLFT